MDKWCLTWLTNAAHCKYFISNQTESSPNHPTLHVGSVKVPMFCFNKYIMVCSKPEHVTWIHMARVLAEGSRFLFFFLVLPSRRTDGKFCISKNLKLLAQNVRASEVGELRRDLMWKLKRNNTCCSFFVQLPSKYIYRKIIYDKETVECVIHLL